SYLLTRFRANSERRLGQPRRSQCLHRGFAGGALRFRLTVTRTTSRSIETLSTRYHGPLEGTVHSIAVDWTLPSPVSYSKVRFCSMLRRFLVSTMYQPNQFRSCSSKLPKT